MALRRLLEAANSDMGFTNQEKGMQVFSSTRDCAANIVKDFEECCHTSLVLSVRSWRISQQAFPASPSRAASQDQVMLPTLGQFLTGLLFPDYLHTVIITHTHRLAVASTWLEVEFGWRFSNTVALLHFMHSSVRTQPAASSLLFKGDGNICLVVVSCCCWSSHCLNLTKGKGTSSLEVKQTVALPKTIWLASCVYSVPVKTAFSVFMLVHVVICLELHEVFHLPFMYFSDSTDLKLDLWRWLQGHCYSNLPVFFNRCTCFMNLKVLCCTDLELSWPRGPPTCLSLAG